jgi:hypothetical protein
MKIDHGTANEHDKFRELAALAHSGMLTQDEEAELICHLKICESCREVRDQYAILATEGIPYLLSGQSNIEGAQGDWDDVATRKALFARIEAQPVSPNPTFQWSSSPSHWWPIQLHWQPVLRAVLTGALIAAVGLVAYRVGSREQKSASLHNVSGENRPQNLNGQATARVGAVAGPDDSTKKISELQQLASQREIELAELRLEVRTLTSRAKELAAANSVTDEKLQAALHEREALSIQLSNVEKDYNNIRAELTTLRSERDAALLHSASLESKIRELNAAAHDNEHRRQNDEQYLASDRDLRELIGARKLYIADVFDVDSHSRTRKPFGRVFYTLGKSLIFYVFDLDTVPDRKKASAFQVWGRKEATERVMNLGILYMDNESNRRWTLRIDNPQQLAEIDRVFVTVEPNGGSQKPTGKPFLYALLRQEPNHP